MPKLQTAGGEKTALRHQLKKIWSQAHTVPPGMATACHTCEVHTGVGGSWTDLLTAQLKWLSRCMGGVRGDGEGKGLGLVGGEVQSRLGTMKGEEQLKEQRLKDLWDSTQAVSLIPCHGSFHW